MIRSPITNTFTGYSNEKIKEWFDKAYINEDGIVLWKSNDRSPFEDMLMDFAEAKLISFINVNKSISDKEAQDRKAIEEYVIAQANRSPEQIAEERAQVRAAFGEGETVVNVFTGETYTS